MSSIGLNRFTGIGNLTKDPEMKEVQSGTMRAKFTVAINRQYKKANGDRVEAVTFVPVIAWGKLAEVCGKYLAKGRQVYVEGRLDIQVRENGEWPTVPAGTPHREYYTQVVANTVKFLGPRNGAPAPIEEVEDAE